MVCTDELVNRAVVRAERIPGGIGEGGLDETTTTGAILGKPGDEGKVPKNTVVSPQTIPPIDGREQRDTWSKASMGNDDREGVDSLRQNWSVSTYILHW